MADPILSVRDLKTYFLAEEGAVRAVDGTSFDLFPGQTLGIVGESGCGKSVTARSILRIVERPGRIIGGEIILRRADGSVADLTKLPADGAQMRAIRGGEIGLVFQEPMSSLSAFHTIGNQLIEAIRLHASLSKRAARARAIELLAMVGIPRPSQRIDAYSFELSGGLRQRVMIALALAAEPRILIADEPTTALDVTTQAQILELIRSLQQQRGLAVILITHDMGVIAEMADHVVVMYLGHEVEKGPIDAIFHAPLHPYTRALLRSIPSVLAEPRSRLATIAGSIPHPFARPPGCPFHPRCPEFMRGTCDKSFPAEVAIAESHAAACHLYAPERTPVPA
ncbi:MAG TPA: ABC transporter ATP-binding protein [Acetobacteraceae bacterium]|jgi:oligopeptide/dipeptide ABC transporter ATP-binding protein|nr:ABC transporter ATP-binding protein [Acetobacteraceae bacterium]